MLRNNIKVLRKSKGLSQDELAVKLHAVRQTVSKWERGLSVPDAEMLIRMLKIFEIPVGALIDEDIPEAKADDLKAVSEKLELLHLQMSQKKQRTRKIIHWSLISLSVIIIAIFAALFLLGSSYNNWGYGDPEYLVIGTVLHSFEWVFVRVAPIILVGLIIGIVLTRGENKKDPM